MLHLKNDDMEELFRKAAENYSVDTTRASDWERVRAALASGEPENNTGVNHQKKKNKKRGLFLWWLLLLPAAWMAHNSWGTLRHVRAAIVPEHKTSSDNNERVKSGDQAVASLPTPVGTDQHKFGNKAGIPDGLLPVPEIKKNHSPQYELKGGKMSTGIDTKSAEKIVIQRGVMPPDNLPGRTFAKFNQRFNVPPNSVSGINRKTVKTIADGEKSDWLSKPDISKQKQNDEGNIKDKLKESETTVPLWQQIGNTDKNVSPPLAPANIHMHEHKGYVKEDISEDVHMNKAVVLQQKGIYLQAIASADFTSVQYQKVKAMGYGAGLLMGYRLNNRWHIEAGAMRERKNYYSKGKYFDASKLGYLSSHVIYDVDGYCNMITIPVSARYNLSPYTRSGKWFVTAGLAAYLMNKEVYDIYYDYYGQAREKNFVYDHPPKSWLATVKLSGGYERRLGKHLQFRIEPYIRIPADKVGSGRLSLQSAGLSIGVGKSF